MRGLDPNHLDGEVPPEYHRSMFRFSMPTSDLSVADVVLIVASNLQPITESTEALVQPFPSRAYRLWYPFLETCSTKDEIYGY